MQKAIHLLFTISILLLSCKEKEKPREGFGKVVVTGIDLTKDLQNPGARTLAKSWNHVFDSPLNLSFENQNGETYSLEIDPNNINQSVAIELPFGSYYYVGTQQSEKTSNTLAVWANGSFNLDSDEKELILETGTDQGLITINESLLSNAAIHSPVSKQLDKRQGEFFTYAKSGTDLMLELTTKSPENIFRIKNRISNFEHLAIQVQSQGEIEEFQESDFDLVKKKIILDASNQPLNFFPFISTNLATEANESSGIAYIQGRLFSINDSDNSPKIQELNPESGVLVREIEVQNATNIDWEDLAQSETHLFIGDFGNNLGKRQDLAIYRIAISDLLNSSQVLAEKMNFSFSDQTDFSGTVSNHNFDCEAFFYLDSELHLFSKNKGDKRSKHYTLNSSGSNQTASLRESLDAQGFITSASISTDGKNIVLLGYEDQGISSQSFVWALSGYSGDDFFFNGTKRRITIGSPSVLSQTEGITFTKNLEVLIAGEGFSFAGFEIKSTLSEMDLTGLF